MNEIEKQTTKELDFLEAPVVDVASPTMVSRRRLIRLGTAAVPVVATLASRPALAWHCKSPSAWGSEIINPNTSLKANAGHQVYADETWTITNWKNNSGRTAINLSNGTDAGTPWGELKRLIPSLKNNETKNSAGKFDYTLVRVRHLGLIPDFVNPGFNGDSFVKDVLTDNPSQASTYILVAQLNYFVLRNARFDNGIDQCLKDGQLKQMALGNFKEGGNSWDFEKIKLFLSENWVVRP